MAAPTVVVFDVNETLSDLTPLGERFAEVGLPAPLAPTWFAQVLRDGFALAVTGGSERFAGIADAVLRTMFATTAPNRPADDAVSHVLAAFKGLAVHPDIPAGVQALSAAGLRLVTLTNGSADIGEKLLDDAGLLDRFERLLSVADAGIWKPAAGAYAYAARQCGTKPGEMMLVAVHPWDLHGAAHAGLQTAWINRTDAPYPPFFATPDITATGLDDLADQLAAR